MLRKQKYYRLSFAEREEISRNLVCGVTISDIARGLKRNKSTISREINKAGMFRGTYLLLNPPPMLTLLSFITYLV